MTMRKLSWTATSWPLKQAFNISRGSKTHADVLTVTIKSGGHKAWSECVPYARYGESLASVEQAFEHAQPYIDNGMSRQELAQLLPAGAARNALDCALWDLSAKQAGIPLVNQLKLKPKSADLVRYGSCLSKS